ncbi:type IV conjugative transfer system pilin TraA [Moritella viscosa]|uniref:type IV conjugative transfer system pilin TraA n=1 Tax=Moritella viscosa TaxID=80854 RepID=UPI000918912F|nr:type IV conjugative transfer system pilin TraA [Moritella viscosa]SGZ09623.1 Conjugative transfer protein TraA, putative fimbrial protein [Moritella viscosa]
MNKNVLGRAVAMSCVCLALTQPALAADLFAGAKTAIKDTVGTGSGVETAILGMGVLGGAISGFMTKNWVGGIGGFVAGMIFWKFAAPLAGL